MKSTTTVQREAITARIESFPQSGITLRLSGKACRLVAIIIVNQIIGIILIVQLLSILPWEGFQGIGRVCSVCVMGRAK